MRRSRWWITCLIGALLAGCLAFWFLIPNHQIRASRHFGERGAAVGFQFHASEGVQKVLRPTKLGVQLLYQTGSVTAIHLRDATLTPADLEHLRHCTELEILDVESCRIGEELIGELPRFRRLNDLRLPDLTDADLATIAKLPALRVLSVTGDGVTDRGLADVGRLTQLQRLYLLHTNVSDAGLPQLAACSNLTLLDVRHTQMTDAGVEALRENLPDVVVRR